MSDIRKSLQKTDESYYFNKMIHNVPFIVTLSCGWIRLEYSMGHTGPFGIFGKERFARMSMTTEDARNLIAAIEQLIPKEECEKRDTK